MDASSRAVVGVPPAVGLAPPFVPSHLCEPPAAVVTVLPSVVTGPSKTVAFVPSTRRFTVTGAATAGTAQRSNRRPARARYRWSMTSLPFPRGILGFAVGGRSPGFRLACRRAFPGLPRGLLRLAYPVTVAGPPRPCPGLPSAPTGVA